MIDVQPRQIIVAHCSSSPHELGGVIHRFATAQSTSCVVKRGVDQGFLVEIHVPGGMTSPGTEFLPLVLLTPNTATGILAATEVRVTKRRTRTGEHYLE